ncbi:MAG: FMN-binding protein [bacterium]
MKQIFNLWTAFFLSSLACCGVVQAQTTVYLKPSDALKLIFKDSQEVVKEEHPLSPELIRQASQRLGYEPPKGSYTFYVGKTQGAVDGYALIDDQVGKVQPITFITRINPQGQVDSVEVMVYRESHGGEVTSRRFLNQFKQKSLNSELRLHGDIINVSGATLSSQALVLGVKRALVLWQLFYGKS